MIVRLILIVISVLLGLVVVNWFWQFLRAADARTKQAGALPRSGEPMVQDPLCRTYLPKSTALSVEIAGRTHYFCSRKCADQYREQATVAGRS
jgi:YHS domain-containing protein